MPEGASHVADVTEVRLRQILDRVDGWLRYAEAKNAGVVALAGTASAAILAFGRPLSDLPPPVQIGVTVSQIVFLASLILGIASFLPQTALRRPNSGADDQADAQDRTAAPPPAAANLYFYAHLARFDAALLTREVALLDDVEAYDAARHPAHLMLAEQICADARITVRKLRIYGWAAWTAMAGALALAVSLLLRLGLAAGILERTELLESVRFG
jgi:hypothetical protein